MIDVRRVEVHPEYLFLDTGSPHYIEFVESVRGVDVAGRGAAIRHSAAFAARRRYERQLRRNRFRRPYPHKDFRAGRRGRDARLRNGSDRLGYRCGRAHGSPCRDYRVDVEGGTLRVAFEPDGKGGFTQIELTGPARKVFEGEFADDFRRDGEPGIPPKILTWHEEAEAARKLCRIQYRTIVNFITFSRIMKSNRGFRHKASDGGSGGFVKAGRPSSADQEKRKGQADHLQPDGRRRGGCRVAGASQARIGTRLLRRRAGKVKPASSGPCAPTLRTASGPCRQPEPPLAVRSVSRADRPGSGTALRADG